MFRRGSTRIRADDVLLTDLPMHHAQHFVIDRRAHYTKRSGEHAPRTLPILGRRRTTIFSCAASVANVGLPNHSLRRTRKREDITASVRCLGEVSLEGVGRHRARNSSPLLQDGVSRRSGIWWQEVLPTRLFRLSGHLRFLDRWLDNAVCASGRPLWMNAPVLSSAAEDVGAPCLRMKQSMTLVAESGRIFPEACGKVKLAAKPCGVHPPSGVQIVGASIKIRSAICLIKVKMESMKDTASQAPAQERAGYPLLTTCSSRDWKTMPSPLRSPP